MAQFKLSMKNQHGATVLTDYDTMRTTGGLTFNEQLNLNVDGSTLSFSMLKYLYEASNKVVNVPAVSITYGTVIQLLMNNYRYDFAVTSIDYQFLSENLQLSFSAQDLFQFETARLGIGYTIVADTTDPEYLGAQPIDYWARKIVNENNLNWTYINIDQLNNDILLNYNDSATNELRTNIVDPTAEEDWITLPKTDTSTLNSVVSFECNNSNAYNALKQLASDNELFIWVDYSARNFGFVPLKNPIFNGYYFNPSNNLQQFSLRGDGSNLITVLNVTGPKDINNQEITLVPDLPGSIQSYILSDKWEQEYYFPDIYNSYTTDNEFLAQIQYVPWLENKLINLDFFTQDNLLLASEKQDIEYTLYNDLRWANGTMIVSWSAYITQYEKDYMDVNQQQINIESLIASMQADNEVLYDAVKNNNLTAIAYYDDTAAAKYISVLIPDGYYIDVIFDEQHTYRAIPAISASESGYIQAPVVTNNAIIPETFSYNVNPSEFNLKVGMTDTQLLCGEVNLTPRAIQILNYWPLSTFNAYRLIAPNIPEVDGYYQFQLLGIKNSLLDMTWYKWQGTSSTNTTTNNCHFGFDLYFHGPSFEYSVQLFLNNNNQFILSPSTFNNLKLLDYNFTDITTDTEVSVSSGNYTIKFKYQIQKYENFDPFDPSQDPTPILAGFTFKFKDITITNTTESIPQYTVTLDRFYLIPNTSRSINFNSTEYGQLGLYSWQDGSNAPRLQNQATNLYLDINSQLLLYSQYIILTPGTQYSYYWTDGSVDNSQYAIIQKGPVTIVLKDDANNVLSTMTIDENLEQNVLQSFYNVQLWTPTINSTIIAGLSDILNKYCTQYDGCRQLYLEYFQKFSNEWKRVLAPDYSVGRVYSTYYKIGVLPSGNDVLQIGQDWSATNTHVINSADINAWRNILSRSSGDILRSEIIQYCAQLASHLTEYWMVAYNAAQVLGYYLPQNWDCITEIENLSAGNTKQLNYVFVRENRYNDPPRWATEPRISTRFNLNIDEHNQTYIYTYKFFDTNQETELINNLTYDHTQLYYTPATAPLANDPYYYNLAYQVHNDVDDKIVLYQTTLKMLGNYYSIAADGKTPLTAEENLMAYLPTIDTFTPLLERWIHFLAQHTQYNLSAYYAALNKHNNIWQSLYTKYPGIFRESAYVNETAGNNHELYQAAKRELEKVSKPEFSYTLTGMDIYMHNSDFMPTRIKLGEQIRIDYQERDQVTTTLNNALREPLFITGIQHSLRDDGDYQFTVTTRSATDTMVQRFAKLLNFNR